MSERIDVRGAWSSVLVICLATSGLGQETATEEGPSKPSSDAAPAVLSPAQWAAHIEPGQGCFDPTIPAMIGGSLEPSLTVTFGPQIFSAPTSGGTPLQIGFHNSPVPHSRLFFGYGNFHNAFDRSGQHLRRFTFGMERCLADGMASLDIRIPLTNGPNPTQTVEPPGTADIDGEHTAFGNISLAVKSILWQTDGVAVSGGLGLLTPTASKRDFVSTAGPRWRVRNQTVGVSPFLAALSVPNDRWFAHGFWSFDLPVGDDSVRYTRAVTGFFPAVSSRGEMDRQALMHLDAGVGYRPIGRWSQYFTHTAELHYTTTLEDADVVTVFDPFLTAGGGTGFSTIGNSANRVDILNLTLGSTLRLTRRTSAALAWVWPLREFGDGQRPFDWAFLLHIDHRFGP